MFMTQADAAAAPLFASLDFDVTRPDGTSRTICWTTPEQIKQRSRRGKKLLDKSRKKYPNVSQDGSNAPPPSPFILTYYITTGRLKVQFQTSQPETAAEESADPIETPPSPPPPRSTARAELEESIRRVELQIKQEPSGLNRL